MEVGKLMKCEKRRRWFGNKIVLTFSENFQQNSFMVDNLKDRSFITGKWHTEKG